MRNSKSYKNIFGQSFFVRIKPSQVVKAEKCREFLEKSIIVLFFMQHCLLECACICQMKKLFFFLHFSTNVTLPHRSNNVVKHF
eukprot:TRINITY_DN588_c0_g1_i1.p1 TRINITY_DN588_c0_g1~~TRINITY_DN588_c0_g1_i1.p1  ORF type:complete len:84 (+),score=9.33 TRINITY_DN588_c0_g1_i1:3-254(+)